MSIGHITCACVTMNKHVDFLQTAPKIFGGKIMTHLLLFVSKKSDKFDEVLASVKESSKKFKGKVSTQFYSAKLQLLMSWFSFVGPVCVGGC